MGKFAAVLELEPAKWHRLKPAFWRGAEPPPCWRVQSEAKRPALGPAQAEERPMTVFVYVNTAKQVGDKDHIKVFANQDAAEKWFEDNDPEGVAFEYEVLE
jgi:hypothetical protein